MTGKRAGRLLGALLLLGGARAFAAPSAETPPIPEEVAEHPPAPPSHIDPPGDELYGFGNLALEPGMRLYIFRPVSARRSIEVGRMKVLAVENGQVKLELLSGSAAMRSGDSLEVEASAPDEWSSYGTPANPTAPPKPGDVAPVKAELDAPRPGEVVELK